MQVFNRHVSAKGLTVFSLETVLIAATILIAARVHGPIDTVPGAFWKIAFATAVCELCFYYNDLYDLTIVHSKAELLVRVMRAAGTAALVLASVTVLVPAINIGHGVFLTSVGLLLVVVPTWRIAFDGVTQDPHLEERVLIVGTGPVAQMVARQIKAQHDFTYRVVGYLADDDNADTEDDDGLDLPLLGSAVDVARLTGLHQINRVIVAISDRRGHLPIQELLRAKLSGVRIEDAATTFERITGKILTDGLTPSWFIFSDGFSASRGTRLIKRMLDLVLAAVGLVAAAPIMLLTALAIRLDSPGPVFYRQERVGENDRLFTLCKFRSMRSDAEKGTPIWAKSNDSRVTRVGRFIRLTRLDELPQLLNVLRGDMSFVGPRPERPYFVQQLTAQIPFYAERHAVKPGVTGWAQVRYRYGSSVEDAMEKLRYDLYYIKHMSIAFDLTIVIDTVKVIVCAKGAQ
ncbi:MAG TPA: TIGR03013 family XrtA/PEP-CTERM system glycosyltransferase [Vicinamibacterales bacterium]|nr:TIGR03013 family XrtA/PEP-CTERM system glycosyltransferase [Vicinamibacterales bacterium]